MPAMQQHELRDRLQKQRMQLLCEWEAASKLDRLDQRRMQCRARLRLNTIAMRDMIDAENDAKPCSKIYCVEYGTEPESSGAVYCKYHAERTIPPRYWTPEDG